MWGWIALGIGALLFVPFIRVNTRRGFWVTVNGTNKPKEGDVVGGILNNSAMGDAPFASEPHGAVRVKYLGVADNGIHMGEIDSIYAVDVISPASPGDLVRLQFMDEAVIREMQKDVLAKFPQLAGIG